MEKKKANKKNLHSYIKKQNPSIVVLNGHGSAVAIAGNDNEIILTIEDAKLLRGTIVFMRACQAAKILGKEIVKNGARGFVGYKEDFVFLWDPEKFNKPLDDELAGPFLECSNQVALSLLKGHSAKEAHESSMKLYRKKIDEMFTSEYNKSNILPFLIWNMTNQVYY